MTYLSSQRPENEPELRKLKQRMTEYYTTTPYHDEWVHGINADWTPGEHDAQLQMCERIPPGSDVLEVGCGDGRGASEIADRTRGISYTGIDLNPDAWPDDTPHTFVEGSADDLSFDDASFDVVLSMFVIEHLVYPARYLDEAWRVLRSGGELITIAPDFCDQPMASEQVSRSYGSGREKLASGRVLDALVTLFDTKVRIAHHRHRRNERLERGEHWFPVLTSPRCLQLDGFVPDCDAVYPACPAEIVNYLSQKSDYQSSDRFYRDASTFGLTIEKAV